MRSLVTDEMTDADLTEWFKEANADLATAAENERESEWHEACFAAVVVLGTEMARRGLKVGALMHQ